MGTKKHTVKVDENDPPMQSGIDPARAAMASRLKAARTAGNYTVVAFGQLGGITKQTQLAYERGASAPDADYLRALHDVLGLDISYLVTGRTMDAMQGLSQQEVETIARYRALPTKIRGTVDDVLLLAWLAYKDRMPYHEPEAVSK